MDKYKYKVRGYVKSAQFETLSTGLFRCVPASHRRAQEDVSELKQSGSKAGHPEVALLLVVMSS